MKKFGTLHNIFFEKMTICTYWYFKNVIQLGVATKLGCEAAIHTTRTFVNNDQNRGKVLLKLDFKNAFNSVERDCILKEVQCHFHFCTLIFIDAIEILQLYFSVII
jgi:hypothetical protein